jgi:DNA replication and repair protein RecF
VSAGGGDPAPPPGWRAHRLVVADLRCWRRAEIALEAGPVLVVGPNGAGKTSLLEGLALACLGVSPRTATEAEMVRRGAEAAHVDLDLEGPDGRHGRSIGYAPGLGRRLRLDDRPVRALGEWRVPGAVLVFIPEELRIVKGPPAARRRHLDRVLEASEPGYGEHLVAYRGALAQRNALLRRVRAGGAGPAGLAPWETQLARAGAAIARHRRRAMARLAAPFRAWLEALGGGPDGRLGLQTSPEHLAGVAEDELESVLAASLADRREREIAAAQTFAGPHRDDVLVGTGTADLRRIGSQGEQRTAALALTLAHRDLLETAAARPILLLDDALSELDPDRRARLLEAISAGGQSLVTTADPSAAQEARRVAAQVVRVDAGRIDVAAA